MLLNLQCFVLSNCYFAAPVNWRWWCWFSVNESSKQKVNLSLCPPFSPEPRSIQTCCQSWSVPASTMSATRSFARGTSHHPWATRATGWFTGATERRVSSTCSSWPTRWGSLCVVVRFKHTQHWHLVAWLCTALTAVFSKYLKLFFI